MDIETIIKFAGGITVVVAAIFALRKLLKLLSPIQIHPSAKIWFDNGSTPDSIKAKITNKSSESQYIVKCEARGTFSIWSIIKSHIKNPFLKPSLYPNIWYNGAVYSLINEPFLKIEPYQPIELKCELYDHPLNAMFTPYFLVKVTLSSGKTICSQRLETPERWKNIGASKLQENT